VVFGDVLLFALKDLILDVLNVIRLNISLQGFGDVWEFILIDELGPPFLSDTVTLAKSLSSINKDGSLVESAVISTNNS